MRMKVKILTPGVKHRQKTNRGAQMLGIGRDGEQGFRYGLEKDAIDLARILECQSADLLRQRKHNVEIRGRQEFSFPLGQPLGARCCLTLWAVSVAARIIGDD